MNTCHKTRQSSVCSPVGDSGHPQFSGSLWDILWDVLTAQPLMACVTGKRAPSMPGRYTNAEGRGCLQVCRDPAVRDHPCDWALTWARRPDPCQQTRNTTSLHEVGNVKTLDNRLSRRLFPSDPKAQKVPVAGEMPHGAASWAPHRPLGLGDRTTATTLHVAVLLLPPGCPPGPRTDLEQLLVKLHLQRPSLRTQAPRGSCGRCQ